jgi:hypothetical protein
MRLLLIVQTSRTQASLSRLAASRTKTASIRVVCKACGKHLMAPIADGGWELFPAWRYLSIYLVMSRTFAASALRRNSSHADVGARRIFDDG